MIHCKFGAFFPTGLHFASIHHFAYRFQTKNHVQARSCYSLQNNSTIQKNERDLFSSSSPEWKVKDVIVEWQEQFILVLFLFHSPLLSLSYSFALTQSLSIHIIFYFYFSFFISRFGSCYLSPCPFFNWKISPLAVNSNLLNSHAMKLFLMFFYAINKCTIHFKREKERERENKHSYMHTLPHKNVTTNFRMPLKCGPNTIEFWCRVEWGKGIEEEDENIYIYVFGRFFFSHPLGFLRFACTWDGLTWIFIYLFDIL